MACSSSGARNRIWGHVRMRAHDPVQHVRGFPGPESGSVQNGDHFSRLQTCHHAPGGLFDLLQTLLGYRHVSSVVRHPSVTKPVHAQWDRAHLSTMAKARAGALSMPARW
jgi:hypothetical protein